MRGRDKLLQTIQGVPLLRRTAQRALATGLPTTVTLPEADAARSRALEGLALRVQAVPEAAGKGMADSIRVGLRGLAAHSQGVMIVPADMPELTTADLHTMAREFTSLGPILRGATQDGRAGHPVVFPARFFAALRKLRGDGGAHPILAAHRGQLRQIALPGMHALVDLDTPEDWAQWLATPAHGLLP